MAKKFISYSLLSKYDGLIKAWVNGLINDVNGDAAALKTVVDTLVGTDTGKSARTIANEEMAAVLLVDPEKGEKNFSTLQALAKYLEDHPEEVADILASIKTLDDKVGELPTGDDAPATVVAYIAKVAADLASEAATARAAEAANKAAIEAEEARAKEAEEANASAINDEQTRAEGAEKALSDRLDVIEGEDEGSIKKAVKDLSDTTVSSTSGEDVKVTLSGTVAAPTIAVELEFASDKDIEDLFAETPEVTE